MTRIPVDVSPAKIREFGLLFSGISALAAAVLWWKGNGAWPWLAGTAGLFLVGGLFARGVLAPLYVLWMRFAYILAWINTRVLLTLVFFLVVTPIGVVLRISRKDFLGQKPDPARGSYWITRPEESRGDDRYRQQF